MTLRQCTGVVPRSALAALAAVSVVSCGQKEPTTDAEQLARGRELVQQMSQQLAAATELTRDDDRTARRGASLGHEGSRVADRRLHTYGVPIVFTRR